MPHERRRVTIEEPPMKNKQPVPHPLHGHAHKRKYEKRLFRSRHKSIGQPPGSLIHIGE
ncbi:MAG TPA: hypothetical protein DEB17_04280 [Chlorobaculum sp.]|uniref:Uncharacterized protein n=1 Tax=Chlorobaculum tepidum (strain ATCC 49652 / DSM 12025 / NBRC 103806 / TLS) TaxID=194439 RepID=Q8KAF9_CHLTE|nr:hypothetical protein CT2203 [Chlorobaculum tepidum TLS]HBU23202.1 hypothetical protein [Chlorobaculum sp.]